YDQVKDKLSSAGLRPPAPQPWSTRSRQAAACISRINKTAARGGSSHARPSARCRATNYRQKRSETCRERSARPCQRTRPERPSLSSSPFVPEAGRAPLMVPAVPGQATLPADCSIACGDEVRQMRDQTLLWIGCGGCSGETQALLGVEGQASDLLDLLDVDGLRLLWHPSLADQELRPVHQQLI